MQLKLGIQEAIPPTTKNSAVRYSTFALCNKCCGTHDMAGSVILEDGPIEKQSIGHAYEGKILPKSLADLTALASVAPRQGDNPFRKTSTKSS
jgi:hypothetical protein